jgi:hypothetical protein
MNWSRGLFRAWLLISALWVGSVCILAVQSVSKSLETMHLYVPSMRKDKGFPADGSLSAEQWKLPYYEIFLPAKSPVMFDVANYETRSTVEGYVAKDRALVVSFPDASRLYLSRNLTKEDSEFISRSFWDQRWSRWWAATWAWVLGGLLPPVLLLVLGYSVIWVGRGFRSRA